MLTYSGTRTRLKEVMDQVVDDRAPVIVTRERGEAVVMVSLAGWNEMKEMLRLLSNPNNASRLGDAVRQLETGGGAERDLIDP